MPLSDPRPIRRQKATMKPRPPIGRVSPVTRITLPACRAHYPGGSDRCARRLLPHPCGLPRFAGGSASPSLLSRPAQASLALRPLGSLNPPRRPFSRGFDLASCPTKPLVSYQSYRQFPGWILPPLVIRALGAHCKNRRYGDGGCFGLLHLFQASSDSPVCIPPPLRGTLLLGLVLLPLE